MSKPLSDHQKTIIDQFTKQAVPFSRLEGHSNALDKLAELTEASAHDTVLDVACGPGIVACALAPHVNHVTGIDITEKMLTSAAELQNKKCLLNVDWKVADVTDIPFPDNSFSLVITRYSFHHFTDPERVFSEMYRVCEENGKIAIIDVAVPEEKSASFDSMERLRDPSHTHALSTSQMTSLFQKHGIQVWKTATYEVTVELEEQLRASFPEKGNDEKIRKMILDDIEKNNLGVNAQIRDDKVYFSYPIAIMIGEKK